MTKNLLFLPAIFTLLIFSVISYAEVSPVDVFQKMQQATKYDEFKTYLAPELRASYEKYQPERRDKAVAYNRYQLYKTQLFDISPNRTILVVYDIVYSDPKRQGKNTKPDPKERRAHDFVNISGKWLMSKVVSANMVIPALLEKKVDLANFKTKNDFSYAGETVVMQSAFAFSESDGSITIEFFPFPIGHSDIEFYKFARGKTKKETGKASAITSSVRYSSTKLVLDFKDNKFSHWNVVFSKFADIPFSETLLANDISVIETVNYDGKNIVVKSSSSYKGLDGKKGEWNIDINLPVFRRGL